MSQTKIVLDRQATAQTFPFGTTSASGQALVTVNNGTAAASNVVLDVKGSTSIAGDLNLTGNLNITGSIDEQTVTNLAVKDLTIRTNKGGTTAGAVGAGLQVEGTSAALIGAISYLAGSATKFQIGDGTTQADIADISTAQTFTNKSISGSQITSAVANATLSAATSALKSATTNVDVSASTAPSSGYVLTASSSTAAAWVAPATVVAFKRIAITGTQDGANKTFTLATAPGTNSDMIIINGITLFPGSSNDYTISGTTLTFATGFTAPAATDVLQAFGNY